MSTNLSVTKPVNVGSWLSLATKKLVAVGIGTGRLDALVLLEDETGQDRAWLLAHPEKNIPKISVLKLEGQIKRRAKHEPLAYIRGFSEFYSRRFTVDKTVLEPRPESETMITLLKNLLRHKTQFSEVRPLKIVDVGTGSGALAVTAKLEIPSAEVMATDIDSRCLKIARQNAKVHKVDIKFYKGDLLSALPTANSQKLTAIMANLPYVPTNWQINRAASHEPRLAIYGGSDGLDVYRRFFEQIKNSKLKPRYILTECLPPQHQKLAKIAKSADFKLLKTVDFIQLFEQVGSPT